MDFWASCKDLGCSDVEIERMTPAKYLALLEKRLDRLDIEEMPIAKLSWLYLNAHRDPGDEDKGRPPAPTIPFDEVRMFKRKRKSSATKEAIPAPGSEHNWAGVKANRAAFEAWGRGLHTKAVKE
jgi:hypothetical protein